ncbi:fungal-specific transcription factor domain-containing protein [Lipomyces oligophaga]|uniref:fungal-specific transcription factor domain-containing protein n=1 Tax=Lipomyces oligophaga TaxID=45792 RepID=UPI0034CD99A3
MPGQDSLGDPPRDAASNRDSDSDLNPHRILDRDHDRDPSSSPDRSINDHPASLFASTFTSDTAHLDDANSALLTSSPESSTDHKSSSKNSSNVTKSLAGASKRRRIGLKRTRDGCWQCRRRRKKCQGQRPQCKSCKDRNWECSYPSNPADNPPVSISTIQQLASSSPPRLLGSPTPKELSLDSPRDSSAVHPIRLPQSIIHPLPLQASFQVDIPDPALPILSFSDDGSADTAAFDDSWDSIAAISSFVSTAVQKHGQQESNPSSSTTDLSKQVKPLLSNSLPSLNLNNLEVDPLSLLSYSREQRELVSHFTGTISSVISYYKHEGPFRKLILSLLIPVPGATLQNFHSTGALLSALCALASVHKSYTLGIALNDQQLTYHTAALEKLISLLNALPPRLEDENTQNVLLASILILVYYEIAKGGYIDSIGLHLNGAYRIITSFLNHVIYRLQVTSSSGLSMYRVSKETLFLFRIFQYFDVIYSLSKKDMLLDSSLQLHHFLLTYSRLQSLGDSDQNNPASTSTFTDEGIDPVIGLAEDLWPMIVRLCILCNDSKFGKQLSPDIVSRASLLELELMSWESPSSPSSSPHDLAMQAAAKVYQLAAQIYLLRTFFPSENVADAIQSHVRVALDQLARVCTLEGNMAALLWPVSVVASECVDSIDRGFVKVVFQKLAKRQGMANVMRGLHYVESGWTGQTDQDVVMFG